MAIIKNPVCIVKAQEQEDVIDYHDFKWTGSTLTKYNIYKTNYTIPYFCTEIGYEAFYGYGDSYFHPFTVSFEENSQLTTIGEYAFATSGLRDIDLPEGLTTIGYEAFQSYNLSSITIPSTVTTIGGLAFEYSTHLEILVVLATTPPSLGGGALSETQIDSVVQGYLEPTGNEAIYVPDESVNAYKSATNWSVYASLIKPISTYLQAEYPDFTWSSRTITGYVGSNLNIEIPKIATAIGNSAFESFGEDTPTYGKVFIPDSITSMGVDCFCQSHIDTITFDENCSITTIPAGFVLRNFGLTSITLPKTITSIGAEAFSDGSLTSITLPINTPPTLGSDVFRYTSPDLKIYVPSNRVNTYKAASGWSDYASQIEAIPSN